MRHLAVLTFFLLLASVGTTAAQAPADTVAGQGRFVRKLSAQLCQRIQDSARVRPLDQLTPEQADRMLQRLMLAGMSEQATDFVGMMQAAEKRNISNYNMGRAIGIATVMRLSTECPSAMELIVRTSSAQKAAGADAKNIISVSAEERAKLQPLADSACAELAAADARQPFKQLSVPAREQKMTQLMQTVMLRNMPVLLSIYTAEQLADEAEMRRFGLKVANLMLTKCPSYLVMLGLDKQNQQQAAARTPAASRPNSKTPAPKGKKPAPRPGVRPAPAVKKK